MLAIGGITPERVGEVLRRGSSRRRRHLRDPRRRSPRRRDQGLPRRARPGVTGRAFTAPSARPSNRSSAATRHGLTERRAMATKDELKRSVCEAIDRQAERIIGLARLDPADPELGFKEFKTARLVEDTLRELGLGPSGGLALTGVRAEAGAPSDGPDVRAPRRAGRARGGGPPGGGPGDGRRARVRPQRPDRRHARRGDGPGRTPGPSISSPAASCSSRSRPRSTATSSGAWSRPGRASLEFLGGKPELLRLGHFDDVDLAMMIHTTSQPEMKKAGVSGLEQRLHREDRPLHRAAPRTRAARRTWASTRSTRPTSG